MNSTAPAAERANVDVEGRPPWDHRGYGIHRLEKYGLFKLYILEVANHRPHPLALRE